MIKITRFDKSEFWINPHQIEFIEATPDTVISLNSGRKVIVKENVDSILKEIIKYRNRLNFNKKQE
ncbi:MAG: flagellar FlbD family protein [Spirochaetes bacterium]|nr:flagellar FlbD family protein [Spirochaetota bacterium]